jgi:hypothetical protein
MPTPTDLVAAEPVRLRTWGCHKVKTLCSRPGLPHSLSGEALLEWLPDDVQCRRAQTLQSQCPVRMTSLLSRRASFRIGCTCVVLLTGFLVALKTPADVASTQRSAIDQIVQVFTLQISSPNVDISLPSILYMKSAELWTSACIRPPHRIGQAPPTHSPELESPVLQGAPRSADIWL